MKGSSLSPQERGLSLSSRTARLSLVLGLSAYLLASACSDADPPVRIAPAPVAVSDVGGSPYSRCTADDPSPGFVNRSGEVEPTVAVDPRDPERFAVAWQQDRWVDGAARGIAVASTADGGETWRSTSDTGFTPCSGRSEPSPARVTDPWLSYGPDGTLHLAALAVNRDPSAAVGANDEEILVVRSHDGGVTWETPRVVARNTDPDIYNDKPSITADPVDPDLVYAVWHRLIQNGNRADGETVLARSNDGGATWQPPQVILGPLRSTQSFGNEVLALPNRSGRSLLVNVSTLLGTGRRGADRARVAVMRSIDNGQTWSDPTIVDDLRAAPVRDPATGHVLETGWLLPRAAGDPGSGAIYISWSEGRSDRQSANDVVLVSSIDGGRSWSEPATVDPTPPGEGRLVAQRLIPELAVTSEGVVVMTYFDFRNHDPGAPPEDPLKTDLFLVWCDRPEPTASDGCEDGWAEQRITQSSFDLRLAPASPGPFLGEYMGLASAGRSVIVAFPVTRSSSDPSSIFVVRSQPDA